MFAFRAHPLVRLFVTRPKIDLIVAVTQGASDAELAQIAASEPHRVEHLRYEAVTLLYGGAKPARPALG
jgi:hypothetical protein